MEGTGLGKNARRSSLTRNSCMGTVVEIWCKVGWEGRTRNLSMGSGLRYYMLCLHKQRKLWRVEHSSNGRSVAVAALLLRLSKTRFNCCSHFAAGMAVLYLLLSCFLSVLQFSIKADATALTTAIAANERLCFFADVDKAGEKIGVSILGSYVGSISKLTRIHLVLLCCMSTLSSIPYFSICLVSFRFNREVPLISTLR